MEINLGDVVARLRFDTGGMLPALQQMQQQLQQVMQLLTQLQQTQQRGAQQDSATAQAVHAVSQAIREQSQAFAQAQQASLAYRQAQDQAREAARQQAAAAREAAQAAREQAREAREAAEASRGGGFLSGLGSQALGVAGGLGIVTSIQGAVRAMKDFAVSLVDVGARMEQLRASFTAISGSVVQSGRDFAFVLEVSNRYGIGLTTLAERYRSLSAATRGTVAEGALTKQIFEGLAQASRTYGLSTEQVGRALVAFEQMLSKNRTTAEELKGQLAEALPGAVQIAARAFGVTTAELEKMVAAGLPAIEFVRRFFAQLRTEMPQGTQNVTTLSQAFTRLGNEITLLKDSIAQSGLNQFLADAASRMARLLEQMRTANQQRETAAQQRVEQSLGPPGTGTDEAERSEAKAVAARLNDEEFALRKLNEQRQQFASNAAVVAGIDVEIKQRQQNIDTLRTEYTAVEASIKLREEARKGIAARRTSDEREGPEVERERQAAIEAANRQLADALKAANKELEQFNLKAALTPELFGKMGSSVEAALTFLDNKIKTLREGLESTTTAILARQREPGAIPPDLLQQQKQLRDELTATEARREAIDQAEKRRQQAEREAEQARRQAEREREQARKQAAREEEQDLRHRQDVIDQLTLKAFREEQQALETLKRLQSQFSQSQPARAADQVTAITQQFPYSEAIQAQAQLTQEVINTREAYDEEVASMQSAFVAIKQQAEALQEAAAIQERYSEKLRDQLAILQAPKDERMSARLRAQAPLEGISPYQESLLQAIEQQEKLNHYAELFGQLGERVGSAWSSALSSVASHTATVAEAFKSMVQSILLSISQLAAQEGWKALLRVGLGLLGRAFAPSTGPLDISGTLGPSVQGEPPPLLFAQGGAVINKPTLIMAGEGETNPEYLLNRHQMHSLVTQSMRSGAAAGGTSGEGVTIMNFPSREQAEQARGQQEALGRKVVLNEILSDLRQGESSQVMRMIRTLQR